MERRKIRSLLKEIKNGNTDIDAAMERLKGMPYEDLGFAKIDTHRGLRKGVPEVVFCKGKTHEQIKKIFASREKDAFIMATRADREIYEAVKKARPDSKYHEKAGIISAGKHSRGRTGKIAVLSAGTADIPVAEEASVTSELTGNRVERIYDVGVAGIHRMFMNSDKLFSSRVVIVVAGMEGALASIVGGLVDKPVIAVPTSIGYGASFGGVAPLLTMLNSCAPGVSVVNIDNGFGAGYMAGLINKRGR